MLLQVKSGKRLARGPTEQEFLDEVIKEVIQAAKDKGIAKPIIACDWDRIHKAAKAALPDSMVLAVPTWSPDFMKAVEHNHAYVVDTFETLVQEDSTLVPHKPQWYMNLLQRVFYEKTTPAVVQPDVQSLQDTFKAVIAAGGDYPPRPFR